MKKRNTFVKGNKVACGKHAPGSGRPADWLKAKCREIVKNKKLVEFLGAVASGVDIDQSINENGECLKIPASIKDRLRAAEMLLDRGYGKPEQAVAVSGNVGVVWNVIRSDKPYGE
jgi:hypothetical protein